MYRKERKIPTIIALFLILAGIGGAFYLEDNFQGITSKATGIPKPSEVHLTNISDNTISVSYLTDTVQIGFVQVTGRNRNSFILDDLDIDGKTKSRITHLFTLKDLEPNSEYKIKITSAQKSCSQKICPEFIQKTGAKLTKSLELPPVSGQIVDNKNQPIDGAIVYLLIGKAAPISGRSDRLGMYVIPLNNLRSQDLLSRPDLSDEATIQLTVKSAPSQYASVITNLGLIKANPKLPVIEIGKTYNFLATLESGNLAKPQVLGNRTVMILSPKPTQVTPNSGIDILFPEVDLDTTIDKNPKLRGIGNPGEKIKITVESEKETVTVTVASDGTWDFRPKIPLSAGTHKITITGKDKNGKTVTITRQFIVLKSGEQVLGEATPSGTLTPTQPPVSTTPGGAISITPTGPTATISATISPTITLTPTATLTPTETLTPTPGEEVTPTPPRSGMTGLTFFVVGGAVSLILLGMKFLL
ncbi:hypothetical protein A2W14_00935 [Candidatus Gottesmanbacteria bacterium RBG_16_37_8]|uniref:Uncharacterized protein n=1 Tax=Candidatus Gottesmanbacteria bacterium RBG_16_37_8 TaxID=1798371 RepID=A0A1F5YQK9_9BACT|nr:MAG: hypothetical protein A2W14_00935 [Candidatus Gottesmanbacteria bacterium RBG_16_37_8]